MEYMWVITSGILFLAAMVFLIYMLMGCPGGTISANACPPIPPEPYYSSVITLTPPITSQDQRPMCVYTSRQTESLSPDTVKEWSKELIAWWASHYYATNETVAEVIQELANTLWGTEIYLRDQEYLVLELRDRTTRLVNGYVYADIKRIFISTYPRGTAEADLVRVKSLFFHEVSHIIRRWMEPLVANETSDHELFKRLGLGA